MEWDIFVRDAKANDKVFFQGLDCSFRGVVSVDVGRHKLEIMFFFGHLAL